MSQSTVNNNNAPTASSQNQTPATVVTKLCHIIKRPDFDGFGFNLHSEKTKPGQYIGKVDPKSPAELAGLKEGDRIIEVNGVSIGTESHKQVVQRIKAIACEVRLLLIGSGDGGSTVAPVADETNKHTEHAKQHGNGQEINIAVETQRNGNGIGNDIMDNNNSENNHIMAPPPPAVVSMQQSNGSNVNTNSSGSNNKVGSLQLPITAAEMRAKLMSKKKYDPKNESVDLKKKFEIIQKL